MSWIIHFFIKKLRIRKLAFQLLTKNLFKNVSLFVSTVKINFNGKVDILLS